MSGRHALIIDDSSVVRKYHGNILKAAGFLVDGASDGAEALEKSLSKSYNIILCDINMPVMDGLTYIKKFREQEKETPIIIITTQEEAVHREKGFEAGANLYVVKPITPEELILHVNMLLG